MNKKSIFNFLLVLMTINIKVFGFQNTTKPNVLLIITDEHNFRTIGAHRKLLSEKEALMWGSTVVKTPNIDRIANEGAILTSMYAAAPVCTPSRAAIFSGSCPTVVSSGDNDRGISINQTTIAKVFRSSGYTTGYVEK